MRVGSYLLLSSVIAGCSAPTAPPDSVLSDAAPKPDGMSPQPPNLACFGPSLAMPVRRGLPLTNVTLPSATATTSGDFLLDLATTASVIDPSAFTPQPQATACTSTSCSYASFDFFGNWGAVRLSTQSLSFSGIDQAGILGTDFFASGVYTLDYRRQRVHQATQTAACSASQLAAAAMIALPSNGFYAAQPSRLRPLRDVDADANAGVTVANVPTVPLQIASITAHAQLDTGFDDTLVPFSININEAFFHALQTAHPGALQRDAARDLSLTTCVGQAESVRAYKVAAGTPTALLDTTNQPALRFSGATVFVKTRSAVTRPCGGIGTWTVPAAQLGAAFFAQRVWSFDPFSATVWVSA